MLSQQRPRAIDTGSLNGHHAQDASVTQSTHRPRASVEEAFKGPAGKLAAALIGIGLFGVSFVAFHLTDTPPEGVPGLLLEVFGYDVLVAHTGPSGVEAANQWRPDVKTWRWMCSWSTTARATAA